MNSFWIYFYDLNDINYGLQKMILNSQNERTVLNSFRKYCTSNKLSAEFSKVELILDGLT